MLYSGAAFGPLAGFIAGWVLVISRLTAFAANTTIMVVYVGERWPQVAHGAARARRAARTVYGDSIVWDNHACLSLRPLGLDIDMLERRRRSGATLVSLNFGDADVLLETMIRMAARFRAWRHAHPSRNVLARTVEDLRCAKRHGRLAIAFDVEGARVVGDHLPIVDVFHELGVRCTCSTA